MHRVREVTTHLTVVGAKVRATQSANWFRPLVVPRAC